MGSVKLIPGKSIKGDANNRHDEADILNMKSFYEQDSHVMPESVKEIHVAITEGIDNLWYEYAPADLTPEEHAPLIISLHGGGQDGYGQCYATSWVLLADKYRFVTIFPTASVNKMWNVNPDSADFKLIDEIIRQAKERYEIDTERIFVQGMSMGNMMTAALCKHKSKLFAGAGMAAGPDSMELITEPDYDFSRIAPIPVFQSRGERDRMLPRTADCKVKDRYELNKIDREFWLKANKCNLEPDIIKVEGRNNLFVYHGAVSNLIYRDVKMRGHGQTVDDAEFVWRTLFSGAKRKEDDSLLISETIDKIVSDEAIILADGCKFSYVNSKKVELSGAIYQVREFQDVPEELHRMDPNLKPQSFGPYTYAPVVFLAKIFGLTLEDTYGGHGAILTSKDNQFTVEVSEGNVACLYNEVLCNMERQAEYKDGKLWIPVKDLAEKLGKTVIEQDGVLYITDHAGEMTEDFAKYMKELLN